MYVHFLEPGGLNNLKQVNKFGLTLSVSAHHIWVFDHPKYFYTLCSLVPTSLTVSYHCWFETCRHLHTMCLITVAFHFDIQKTQRHFAFPYRRGHTRTRSIALAWACAHTHTFLSVWPAGLSAVTNSFDWSRRTWADRVSAWGRWHTTCNRERHTVWPVHRNDVREHIWSTEDNGHGHGQARLTLNNTLLKSVSAHTHTHNNSLSLAFLNSIWDRNVLNELHTHCCKISTQPQVTISIFMLGLTWGTH